MERNKIYMRWFYLFAAGFLIGIVIMNIGKEALLTEDGIFSFHSMIRLKYMEIDNQAFLPFVLKKRLSEAFILLLVSTTMIGTIVIYFEMIGQGLLLGMLFTAGAVRFGMKGLLLVLAGILPHQLILIPAEAMLLCWCYENCCGLKAIGNIKCLLEQKKRKYLLRQGAFLVWILFILVVGCILESYVNPILIFEILKIF